MTACTARPGQDNGTSHDHRHRMTATATVRAAVRGWLEHIRVADPAMALWCDEEGRLRGRTVNPVGSRLAVLLGGRPVVYVGPIVSPATTARKDGPVKEWLAGGQ
jgi:hypothetical protein